MASVIDIISTGVATPELNKALNALVSIFGEKMINGTGSDASMLVNLSAALNPVYIGLLFVVLAYIGVGGVVNSAIEGRFLGRWSSVGVPGMFMFCLVLLSPIPSQNGVTLGQYVFVKSLKFGSNFADYMLYKVFETAKDEASAKEEAYTLAPDYLPKVNTQMTGALPMYICGENLKSMGYGTRVDYFILLKEVCGIPADLHGTNSVSGFTPQYQSYFMLEQGNVREEQQYLDSLAKMAPPELGIKPIKQTYYTLTKINEQAAANGGAGSQSTQQLACHFKAFNDYFNTVPQAAQKNSKVTGRSIETITPATRPTRLNSNVVKVNTSGLEASWAFALNSAYECLLKQTGKKEIETPTEKSVQDANSPWSSGWVDAAMTIQDNLGKYKAQGQAEGQATTTELPLLMNYIVTPDYTKLGDSLSDKKNAALLMNSSTEVYDYMMRPDNSPSKIANMLASARLQKFANNVASVAMDQDELARIVAAGVISTRVKQTYNVVNGWNAKQKSNMLTKIFNSLLGKAATVMPAAIGSVSKLAAQATTKIHLMFEKKAKLEKLAEEAGSAQIAGFSVGKLVSIGKKIYDFAKPSAAMMAAMTVVVIVLNAIMLLPQLVLLIVMLLWMARAAVWYMIIPLATVIIALPNTRAGHDIWKSALSIVLTPMLALIFYLVSLFLFDQMYSAVFMWIFAPIAEADNWAGTGAAATGIAILEQIFTGEIVFRFMMGFGVAIAVTMYMSMMILRGPDLVTKSLGLSGSSGDLGQDLENLRHSKTMNLGAHGIV